MTDDDSLAIFHSNLAHHIDVLKHCILVLRIEEP